MTQDKIQLLQLYFDGGITIEKMVNYLTDEEFDQLMFNIDEIEFENNCDKQTYRRDVQYFEQEKMTLQ
jgi:bacillopeptidase F (M6 metalloprotease family)